MSRMSELHIDIQDMLAAGMSRAFIAKELNIPEHWIPEILEEQEYQDHLAYADRCADADAIHYGTR